MYILLKFIFHNVSLSLQRQKLIKYFPHSIISNSSITKINPRPIDYHTLK